MEVDQAARTDTNTTGVEEGRPIMPSNILHTSLDSADEDDITMTAYTEADLHKLNKSAASKPSRYSNSGKRNAS